MDSQKFNENDLLKYKEITKEFDLLKFEKNISKKMKIRYNNPDDNDKNLIVESLDDVIFVRNKEMFIEQKSSEFIRLTFNIPNTLGTYTAHVIVKDKYNGEIEEILKFKIRVVN